MPWASFSRSQRGRLSRLPDRPRSANRSRIRAAIAEQGVGGGVVADGEHQLAQALHVQRHGPGHMLHRAAAGDLLIVADRHHVPKAGLPTGSQQQNGRHERELDHAGGQKPLVRPEASFLSAVQILIVKPRLAIHALHFPENVRENGLFCGHIFHTVTGLSAESAPPGRRCACRPAPSGRR